MTSASHIMNVNITQKFTIEALAESVLDSHARALYDLRFLYRNSPRDEIVADKLRLIGRLHAGHGFSRTIDPLPMCRQQLISL